MPLVKYMFCSCRRLQRLGGLEWKKVVHQHQGWRLITCIWLHAGVIHLIANMLSLLIICIRLEQQCGFGMLYVMLFLVFGFSLSFFRFYTEFHLPLEMQLYTYLFSIAVHIGIIYLFSGAGGSILSSLFIQRSISVGASGALFGLLGAMLSELITNWSIYTNRVCNATQLFPKQCYRNQFLCLSTFSILIKGSDSVAIRNYRLK